MSDYDDFDSDYYDDFDDYDDTGYDNYDEAGYENYDEDAYDEGGYDDYYYDDEGDSDDDYTSTDIDLDSLIDNNEEAEAGEGKSRRWLWIIGGLVGVFVVLPLLCFAIVTVVGIGSLGAFAFLAGSSADEIAAVEETPIVTLVPTAGIAPEDTAVPDTLPTPTPLPVSAEFTSPPNGAKLNLGESVEVIVRVVDGAGITSVGIEGSGLAPTTYNGEAEVTFSQRWAPENAGFYGLGVTVRNRLGETSRVPGITVQVVDRGFIEANAPTFNRLNADVAALRGLEVLAPIEPILMGQDGVRRYLQTDFTPEDAYNEMLVLSSFDLVPRGFDLYEPAVEYNSVGIAGFYDPEADVFVIVSTDNEVSKYEELIYVHELMHALQDQHFQLALLSRSNFDNLTNDQALALRGLAEGEAELLQRLYLEGGYFDNAQVADISNELEQRLRILADVQQRSEAPAIWTESFLFAYEEGGLFANELYNRFGWTGINEAWVTLPVSSEQILHPDRYIDGDVPLNISVVRVGDILGANWIEIDNDVFGEFYLRQYLSLQLGPAAVDQASTGWGGDRYVVYHNPGTDETVMAMRIGWDTPLDSQQFAGAFNGYANAAYGNPVSQNDGITCRTFGEESLCIGGIGIDWMIVRAPTIELAREIILAQP